MKNIQKYQLAWKQKPLNEKHDFWKTSRTRTIKFGVLMREKNHLQILVLNLKEKDEVFARSLSWTTY